MTSSKSCTYGARFALACAFSGVASFVFIPHANAFRDIFITPYSCPYSFPPYRNACIDPPRISPVAQSCDEPVYSGGQWTQECMLTGDGMLHPQDLIGGKVSSISADRDIFWYGNALQDDITAIHAGTLTLRAGRNIYSQTSLFAYPSDPVPGGVGSIQLFAGERIFGTIRASSYDPNHPKWVVCATAPTVALTTSTPSLVTVNGAECPTKKRVMLDAGHGAILTNGVWTFQREPSPTFALREDNLTLDMALRAQALLSGSYTVLLTRTGTTIPSQTQNCAVPCFIDLRWRREKAEKEEVDAFVSIHTNANTDPALDGVQVYTRQNPAMNSAALAQELYDQLADIPLRRAGLLRKDFNVLSPTRTSVLVEVGFHTNYVPPSDGFQPDETRLNSPNFRQQAAQAIADAVDAVLTP